MNSRSHTVNPAVGKLWATVTLLILAVATGFIGHISGLEYRAYDYFQLYQYKTASDQILLLTVDSRTEKQRQIWTGEKFGELANTLDGLGARLIVATQPIRLPDVPDEDQIRALEQLQRQASQIASLNGGVDPLGGQLTEFRKRYDDRQQLARQFTDSGKILLSAHITSFALENNSVEACAEHGVNTQGVEVSALPRLTRVRHVAVPPANICSSVRALGISSFTPDDDGFVRQTDLVINADGVYLPSLALSADVSLRGINNDIVVASSDALAIGERIIRTGPKLQLLNRYYVGAMGKPAFREISLRALQAGNVDPALIRDRIVLVGESVDASMPGIATPVDSHMSPLLLVATNLSNLLENDFLLRPEWLPAVEIGALASLLVLALLWVPAMPLIGSLLMGVLLAVIVLSLQAWFLVSEGIWIQLASVAIFAALAVWVQHVFRAIYTPVPRRAETLRPAAYHGTSNQSQLDLEFSVLRQQAPTEETKEKMYEIAMIHGNAKEFARAEKVLLHINKLDPNYRDVRALLNKLSGARKRAANSRRKISNSVGTLDRRQLGRYEIEKVLGKGAMATVYLGRDPAINRKVAIKTLALAREFDHEELQNAKVQFRREAESAGRLNHPNIIAIYDAGEDDDVSYLAMEYFQGVSLLNHTSPDNLMPAKWVLELAARAAEALDYAHRQNVVHRDIKPANLMYHAATDTLKITDFGIARLTDNSRTKTGVILGTPSYMSPEQLSAAGVTGQSDLYSLGITMYQLLTGHAPFRADSIPKLMDKILNEKHTPVSDLRKDLPACVDVIVSKSMAKNPARRFTSGREMAIALRECAKNF
ncbi:MAG: serine/threonine-protein kinase [Gammaproteobacteria bacterium]|jgi:CHASE2 domain-containing sensor protein/tRNA A-37 threonylcarbamoyl transferase component Bud32